MSTYQEKLGIITEMIAFAKADDVIRVAEYNFLLGVSNQLGIDRETFDSLFREQGPSLTLKSHEERILQFHRLLLLMNVDQEQHATEIYRLRNIGLGMGLPPSAIDQVLQVMHEYPDKIVPPDVLISIFKAHFN
ncbi:TerB family tellurite resistance protein [Zeaxanthinibacter enoshimensis]|uniref:Tellurite resistance protein TerB n=1 Tax=Zeaxanthinibacter enoshimensis TaxID=392009 RepID=A0A4R6TJ44_9FLAO|nr:TerB family tellurite resistance protein [Zeaxanthinibacter enoshimensis]TDQ29229.1 hypothetical protein CLV82_2683 [Zeaxanthinibacter enoshimensis]